MLSRAPSGARRRSREEPVPGLPRASLRRTRDEPSLVQVLRSATAQAADQGRLDVVDAEQRELACMVEQASRLDGGVQALGGPVDSEGEAVGREDRRTRRRRRLLGRDGARRPERNGA